MTDPETASWSCSTPTGVGGTTIWPDGRRAYWTEGRSSVVMVRCRCGSVEVVAVGEHHSLVECLDALFETGGYDRRDMAEVEVEEWRASRDFGFPAAASASNQKRRRGAR